MAQQKMTAGVNERQCDPGGVKGCQRHFTSGHHPPAHQGAWDTDIHDFVEMKFKTTPCVSKRDIDDVLAHLSVSFMKLSVNLKY